jgi:hypothetical protein
MVGAEHGKVGDAERVTIRLGRFDHPGETLGALSRLVQGLLFRLLLAPTATAKEDQGGEKCNSEETKDDTQGDLGARGQTPFATLSLG